MKTMKTMLFAAVAMTVSGLARADVPAGPDEINGSFARMLDHEPAALVPPGAASGDATDFQFERWINAVARGDKSSLEAGFAHLLARVDDEPAALLVTGERDPVEVMVTAALQAQRLTVQQRAAL